MPIAAVYIGGRIRGALRLTRRIVCRSIQKVYYAISLLFVDFVRWTGADRIAVLRPAADHGGQILGVRAEQVGRIRAGHAAYVEGGGRGWRAFALVARIAVAHAVRPAIVPMRRRPVRRRHRPIGRVAVVVVQIRQQELGLDGRQTILMDATILRATCIVIRMRLGGGRTTARHADVRLGAARHPLPITIERGRRQRSRL